MNILLIDDLRNFLDEVLVNLDDEDVITIARNSTEAMNILINNPDTQWEQIWFDHDLGGDDRAMGIMDWMNEKATNGNPINVKTILVHTDNSEGGRALVQGFQRYGYNVIRVKAKEYFIVEE